MNITPETFEDIMSAIDADETVTEKIKMLILRKMRECNNFQEFDAFLETLEVEPEPKPKRKRGKKNGTTS